MDEAAYWEIFCETGAPEAYMLYCACREEEECPQDN